MQCPTHKKKLVVYEDPEPNRRCDICGQLPKLKCSLCKFVLCGDCRICLKKHFLVKIVELFKACTSYYNNGYKCDTCQESKTVDDDGIWHCTECKYDICPKCTE